MQGLTSMGVGPTMLGLGALGLLFMAPMIVKLIRLTTTTPPKQGTRSRFANVPVEEEAFDADAALARYLARKAEAGEEFQAVVPAEPGEAPANHARPVFGRKIT